MERHTPSMAGPSGRSEVVALVMNCVMLLYNDMGSYEVSAVQREKGQTSYLMFLAISDHSTVTFTVNDSLMQRNICLITHVKQQQQILFLLSLGGSMRMLNHVAPPR